MSALARKTVTREAATLRLEALCTKGERCEWELREKLRQWALSPSDATAILEHLRKYKFYDDRRFAEAFVRDKILYNRWGKRKVSVALYAKRLSSSLITEALDSFDPDEYLRILHAFLRAKARTIAEGNTYEGRTRLYRSALQRGFEPSLVATAMRLPTLWTTEEEE